MQPVRRVSLWTHQRRGSAGRADPRSTDRHMTVCVRRSSAGGFRPCRDPTRGRPVHRRGHDSRQSERAARGPARLSPLERGPRPLDRSPRRNDRPQRWTSPKRPVPCWAPRLDRGANPRRRGLSPGMRSRRRWSAYGSKTRCRRTSAPGWPGRWFTAVCTWRDADRAADTTSFGPDSTTSRRAIATIRHGIWKARNCGDLHEAPGQIGPDHRDILVLSVIEDMDYGSIAAALQIPGRHGAFAAEPVATCVPRRTDPDAPRGVSRPASPVIEFIDIDFQPHSHSRGELHAN